MGEQLFLCNLEVIRGLKKQKQKQLQLILWECAALQGALPRKLCLTRSFAPRLALPLLLSASIPHFPSFSSSLCLAGDFATFHQPAANTLRRPMVAFTLCCHQNGGKFPGKGQEHTALWSSETTCFINGNEGAAEASEVSCWWNPNPNPHPLISGLDGLELELFLLLLCSIYTVIKCVIPN